jgi:hypothetical protein
MASTNKETSVSATPSKKITSIFVKKAFGALDKSGKQVYITRASEKELQKTLSEDTIAEHEKAGNLIVSRS